jgi:hypothetical protein
MFLLAVNNIRNINLMIYLIGDLLASDVERLRFRSMHQSLCVHDTPRQYPAFPPMTWVLWYDCEVREERSC